MLMQQIDGRLVVIGRCGHNHATDRFHIEEGPAGADKDGQSGQRQELFRLLKAEAGTYPPGRNDDPGCGAMESVVWHALLRKKG